LSAYLPPTRDIRERLDTAQLLSRFHHGERALALACGRFIPFVRRLEEKAELARTAWEAVLAVARMSEPVQTADLHRIWQRWRAAQARA